MNKDKNTQTTRIALAQINCTVGDLDGNRAKITNFISEALSWGADVVAFPELAICGYPPEDLLHKPKFIKDNLTSINKVASFVKDIVAIIGFVDTFDNNLYNAAAVIYKGKIIGKYHKTLLPNYGVFDEKRYFSAGDKPFVFKYGLSGFGVNICEDIWHKSGPTKLEASLGAGCIININASPYHAGKLKEREAVICKQAQENNCFVAYVNAVGGQDELVFDGSSLIVDKKGKIIARAKAFKEDLLFADIEIKTAGKKFKKGSVIAVNNLKERIEVDPRIINALKPEEEVYNALTLGLKDYVLKNYFKKVVIGLSGGIDSSLVAAFGVDALGKDSVVGVFMPSRFSSHESKVDAQELAANLGIKFLEIPIEEIYKTYLSTLEAEFKGCDVNITEENLQARIRGNILMALSNKFGWLVLTTGNKSEMSTGYATLYGDMAGGFAVIKDVPKTLVYKLSRYRNTLGFVVPERVLTKEPTAELKFNQKDSDSLPVYPVLDPILKLYIEDDLEVAKIISKGYPEKVVKRVQQMVDSSEYKRRQAPPGIKITPKSFGRDRRMPITNKYRG